MNEPFDPYLKWLGIPPRQQPPHHYRLLAIEAFESDPDVIANAADARMAHLKTFATGKHSALSQRLLNEVSAARVCLLNPEQKARYDEALRAQLEASATKAPKRRQPTTSISTAPDELVVYPQEKTASASADEVVRLSVVPSRPRTGARPRDDRHGEKSEPRELSQLEVVALVAGLIVVVAVGWLCYKVMHGPSAPQPRKVASKTAEQEKQRKETPPPPEADQSLPSPGHTRGKASAVNQCQTPSVGASVDSGVAQPHPNDVPRAASPKLSPTQVPAPPSAPIPVRDGSKLALTTGPPVGKGQPQPQPARLSPYALKFDGSSSYVLVKGFRHESGTPLTVEAIAQLPADPSTVAGRQAICGNSAAGGGLGLGWRDSSWCFEFHEKVTKAQSPVLQSERSNSRGTWVHVAGVSDAKQLRLFVDGKLAATRAVAGMHVAGVAPFLIGAAPKITAGPKNSGSARNVVATQYHFAGLVREVRVSSKARYRAGFTPPKALTADGDTRLLLRFTEGSGNRVTDLSPSKYVAEIHGTQWVNVDVEP